MPFEVSARTILQLGRELISSDGVAFYELIKNAFDAQEVAYKRKTKNLTPGEKSKLEKEVWVKVIVRLPFKVVQNAHSELRRKDITPKEVKNLAKQLASQVDLGAPGGDDYRDLLDQATAKQKIRTILDTSSIIEFQDLGEGMSNDDLNDIYLLIGTTSRKDHDDAQSEHVFLGEKGIGRLSTMRLGNRLLVKTAKKNDKNWNNLEIDWRAFEKHALLEDVDVEPSYGDEKSSRECGTQILLTALRDEWSEEKLRYIGNHELSRFVDPFSEHSPNQIYLSYNGAAVGILPMNKLLFKQAHATVVGGLKIRKRGGPLFWADIEFRQFDRFEEVRIEKADLLSFSDSTLENIQSLGQFNFVFYWFNRQALVAVEAIGKKRDVQKLVNQWSGGLMLYRDGFRVAPYGGTDDDWLKIDRVALSSQGYKVNRAQLVGKIDITKLGNPKLADQTNREGLQDTAEKKVLEKLMFKLLMTNFRSFINQVEEEESLSNFPAIATIEARFEDQKKQLLNNVRALKIVAKDNPELGLEVLAKGFSGVASKISKTISMVTTKQKDVESRGKRIEDLAGLGLLVDMVAHDLNNSLVQSMTQIRNASKASSDRGLLATLKSAEAQLKTLQKRVSRIDKAAISGRQRKSKVKVYDVINNVLEGRAEQLKNSNIKFTISDSKSSKGFSVRFVEGMLYQIFENLIENSIYWLRELQSISPSHPSEISVNIDASNGVVYFSDNGPGVAPANQNRVFGHGFSLKRKTIGKGLGLYISKVWAEDQEASLQLSNKSDREDGYLNTFILEFSANIE